MGVWSITDYRMPGVPASPGVRAADFVGQRLSFSEGAIDAANQVCHSPGYAIRTADTAELFRVEYRLAEPPADIGALPDSVEVVEASCPGWSSALGSRLIVLDDMRALALWEGIFFLLERSPTQGPVVFAGSGAEPGWRIEIVEGRWIHLAYDYGEQDAYVPIPSPTSDPVGRVIYHAITEASDLLLSIEPGPCVADGSGRTLPSTVVVTLNGQTFRGCGDSPWTPE